MRIYYASLHALEQQTRSLFNEQCPHCKQSQQLISHGFVYKKRSLAQSNQPVGKRVFCSNRDGHTGCGRTMRLYLDTQVRYLHYLGGCVVIFVLALLKGGTMRQAYRQATCTAEPRHAYRWLHKLFAQLSEYRGSFHRPVLQPAQTASPNPRRSLLASTFTALLQQFGSPLCACYQQSLQRSFL